MVAEYPRPDHQYSTSRGSMEILPNGNVFMGWTFHSRISEHAQDGRVLMKAKLPPQKNTYRSYKAPWTGRPVDPPDVLSRAVEHGSSKGLTTEVYVSWNGATNVEKWNVYQADLQGGEKKLVTSVKKMGFETSVKLEEFIPTVIVEASDSEGRSLGQSKLTRTIPADRDEDQFNEEQEWLDEHVPTTPVELTNSVEGERYGSGYSFWNQTPFARQHATLAAYIGGVLTCCTFAFLYFAGSRSKHRMQRRRQTAGYEQVYKEDQENEHELDDGVGESDGFRSQSTTPANSDGGSSWKGG
ncbi:uncharacterized protein LTR77_010027 [Saxophila tyrrhenica]|uniref:Uncharacterized protein n=1 Tax=Saxophila tyrrhenica TaxID=1690608 RepID=A0AAV9NWQ0_9PEZI|nr:hypothetical protein LTR77_010027 [Saxophila tyrrhenica]